MTIKQDVFDNFEDVTKLISKYFDFKNTKIITVKEDEDHEEFGGGMYVTYDFHKKFKATIHLVRDTIVYEGNIYNAIYERLFKYFELMNLNNTRFNRTLILLVHEFGHVDHIRKMLDAELMQQYMYITDVVRGALIFSLTDVDVDELRDAGIDAPYILRGDEMYADAFAIKYFIAIKRYLEDNGIKDEEDI